ncbi:HEAT repeat domain-containing protein [Pseudobacteriovorax antillogorgiicola]|uniref:HEAT repeat-containing protein n=1 Tax=Pseudobacteriovorax antillogorgiicola TaxID=1513793 RepID=A0A1Y6CJM3_9BACT|nr:HEAT repeat domain-containing protein [Pseudobacteriovorax antillogorgiicola]TCS46688.1 hypothetical protein EDD56_12364 [Pseudobacteriovorax antillogorgiicola]SMF66749.1 hypothetical protein SAMN06296036_12364 [Pseudobacteriovorax antillogorgiicola]
MGLFGKFKDYQATRSEKRLEKAAKLVKNPKAIKEDRWSALKFLADDAEGAERVINALLSRFEYSLEHGILDSREKDLALKGVIRFGEEGVPVIEEWIKKTDRIAWPIKALKAVTDEKQVVESLKAALVLEDVRFDQAKVDKNYDILCYMRDFQLSGFEESISHFLKDSDERVRFAAAESLIEQESNEVAQYLEPFLSDTTSENRRIKEAVTRAFIERKWPVKDGAAFTDGYISDNARLSQQGLVERV